MHCAVRSLALSASLLLAVACAEPSPATAPPTARPRAALVTVRYEVRDLVHPRSPDSEPFVRIADLAQNLKDATDPLYWSSEGTEIRLDEVDVITVTANQVMQARVTTVLEDLRRLAAKG